MLAACREASSDPMSTGMRGVGIGEGDACIDGPCSS